VGQTFGDLRLLAELGRGAQGRVYLATQLLLADRPVVLKLTPRNGQEHLSLARLQHTHIVPLYWAQDIPDRNLRALCMPYLGGTTLAHLLHMLRRVPWAERTGQRLLRALDQAQAATPLDVPRQGPARQFLARSTYVRALCRIGFCLAEALHYAHERGLVHLDLKPSNVLLASDGQPMLLDFHLAREPVQPNGPVPEWLGGTQAYMSPEQRLALAALREDRPIPVAVDARSDVYSLGLVLYQALGGTVPGAEETTSPVAHRRSSSTRPDRHAAVAPPASFPRLDRCNPQVSVGLADIISKCLAPKPADRYADAATLATDLRCHLENQPLRGVGDRSLFQRWSKRRLKERWDKWRRRRPHALFQFGLVTLILLGALTWGLAELNAYNHRLRESRKLLSDGKERFHAGAYEEAERTLLRGLELSRSLPLHRDLPPSFEEQLRLTRWAQQAEHLHEVTEQLRFQVNTLPPEELVRLEEPCQRIWDTREQLLEREEAGDQVAPIKQRIKSDLLDLAILWTEMRVELAPTEGKDEARCHALEVLAKAGKEFGLSPALLREQWTRYQELGQWEKAEEVDRQAHRYPPVTAWDHYALARSYLRGEDLEETAQQEAAQHLERALDLQPQGFWPNFYQGCCALRRGRSQEAVTAFHACVVLAPKQAYCYYHRALAYAQSGDSEHARRDFGRALDLNPNLAAAAANRGIVNYQDGQTLDKFPLGLCRLPPLFDPCLTAIARGALLVTRGEFYRRAQADFVLARKRGGDRGMAHYNLALVDLAQGHWEAARENLKLVPSNHPRADEVSKLLSNLLAKE
jgi:serine/threonine protein kinase